MTVHQFAILAAVLIGMWVLSAIFAAAANAIAPYSSKYAHVFNGLSHALSSIVRFANSMIAAFGNKPFPLPSIDPASADPSPVTAATPASTAEEPK